MSRIGDQADIERGAGFVGYVVVAVEMVGDDMAFVELGVAGEDSPFPESSNGGTADVWAVPRGAADDDARWVNDHATIVAATDWVSKASSALTGLLEIHKAFRFDLDEPVSGADVVDALALLFLDLELETH